LLIRRAPASSLFPYTTLFRSGAYRCYASPEELAAMREKARSEGRAKLYDGRWRDRDPSEAPSGVKSVVRLKAPLTGETAIEDQVDRKSTRLNSSHDQISYAVF